MKKLTGLLIMLLFPALLFAQVENVAPKINENQIVRTEINPHLYSDLKFEKPVTTKVKWSKIKKDLDKKYNDTLSEKLILVAQERFYRLKKDWTAYANAYLTFLEKHLKVKVVDIKDKIQLAAVNNVLYDDIFKNVNDKSLLRRAAKQSLQVVHNQNGINPLRTKDQLDLSLANKIDTYANLLYKAGEVTEAIEWQSKSVELSKGANSEFESNLTKMKLRQPTW